MASPRYSAHRLLIILTFAAPLLMFANDSILTYTDCMPRPGAPPLPRARHAGIGRVPRPLG
eukprot:6076887-Prymnesium_polylepis.1